MAETITNADIVGPWDLTVKSTGTLFTGGALHAPLGMTMAPNGDLIVVNGNNGNAVEISPAGRHVAVRTLIRNGAGDLFGIITAQSGDGLIIANDGTNALDQVK